MQSYLLALGANLCFSSATLVFSIFVHRTSVIWVNTFKAMIATVACAVGILLFFPEQANPGLEPIAIFLLSGLLGLNFADIFLLNAFARIGPSRTLLMYGFQPFFLSLGGYFVLHQELSGKLVLGFSLMFICLLCISYERYRQDGKWELGGLAMAVLGVSLDASGVMLSRVGMNLVPEMPVLVSHFYRSVAALSGFLLAAAFGMVHLKRRWVGLTGKEKALITAASFWGTFLSLFLWLSAIRTGHLGSIASISMTGPFFAGIFEHIYQKRWPSLIYVVSFIFFVSGFLILIRIG